MSENHADGWMNILTGMGMQGHDKKMSTAYLYPGTLTSGELSDLYRSDGFSRKLIDRPVWDAMREGWEVSLEGDEVLESGIQSYLDGLSVNKQVSQFLQWDRLYGSALLIIGAQDGGTLDQPLNPDAIRTIEFLRIIEGPGYNRTFWTETDPLNKRFGLPVRYQINPSTGITYNVHYTRCYELLGIPVPTRSTQTNAEGKGDSVLQTSYSALRNLGVTYSDVESVLDDFVTGVLSIKNLQAMIASGNEKQILDRLHIMDMCRHIINTTLLDAEGETYSKITTSVAGLPELVDRSIERLSAVSNMPVRILLGKQVGGLNNAGEGETRDYYDMVASYQTDTIQPVLEWLTDLMFRAKDGPTKGAVPAEWQIEFNPLWQMSEKEKADIYQAEANADQIYIMQGVLSATEVAQARFSGEGSPVKLLTERLVPDATDVDTGSQSGNGGVLGKDSTSQTGG